MPTNLVTSMRLITATDTLSSIGPILAEYDIHGYAEHTPAGIASIRSIEVFRGNPRSGYLNLGKGFGFDAALASGYMEAIEVSTIEQAPQVPVLSTGDLAPVSLVYTAARKAAQRAGMLDDKERHRPVIGGVDLLTSMQVYGYVDENFLPQQWGGERLHLSTDGLASGNSLAEARLHAIYELLERHVAASSLRALGQVLSIALEDIPLTLRKALDEIEQAGWRSEFFLLGWTLGVTVIQCALSPLTAAKAGRSDVHFGWGAHHSLSIAVARALAEAVQGWATRAACQLGNIPPARMKGGMLLSSEQLMGLKSGSPVGEQILHAHLRACRSAPASLGEADEGTLAAAPVALEQVLSLAREAGISHVLSWTLSPPHRPFAVVKCVIPEFESLFS
ncbi:unnamed protein product (plasmid) [Mycetohabitans rhizoxinica HKI 454]|uniref:YcaO domain-containing protein n=2 Tax=Burkholderiaceae TaxID=119060 RepID=E5AUX2_MYCRK|nr:unnamed protein product [Mycetohabitans rhizoxinica HKI 454]